MSGAARWYRELPGRPWWIALGWLLVVAIVVLSLVSLPQIGLDIPQGDKYKHLLVYLALTLWFAQLTASRRSLLVHAALFVLLGAALEGLQSLTPDRQLEIADMLANAMGVALAIGLALAGSDRVLVRLAKAAKRQSEND